MGDHVSLVIPGRAEGASPESITQSFGEWHDLPNNDGSVVMDSGPAGFARVPE
jgi:hypothetical protein